MIFQTLWIPSGKLRLIKGLNATDNLMPCISLGEGCVDVKHGYDPIQLFIDFSVLSFRSFSFPVQFCETPGGGQGSVEIHFPLRELLLSRSGRPWENENISGGCSEIKAWNSGHPPIFFFNETLKITSTEQWGQTQRVVVWEAVGGVGAAKARS